MGKIRIGPVALGGVVASLVIFAGEYLLNGMILAEDWVGLRRDFGLTAPGLHEIFAGGSITLAYGISLVWLYAAMRSGLATDLAATIAAAFTFWAIAYVLFLSSLWVSGFFTPKMAWVSMAWGLIEASIAAAAGAKVYRAGTRDEGSGTPSSPST